MIQLPFAQFRALLISLRMHILSIHAIERIKLRSFIDQRLRLLYTSTAPYKKWMRVARRNLHNVHLVHILGKGVHSKPPVILHNPGTSVRS